MTRPNVSSYDPDGRYATQYAADHCVCAYCWGVLIQIFDDEEHIWKAVCAENDRHVGFHHAAFKTSQINRHSVQYAEVAEFYRQTEYAAEFGLTPRPTGEALQNRLAAFKRMLGHDDSGLFPKEE